MPDVWLVPYIPLSSEERIGPWALVPFRDFRPKHCTTRAVHQEVRRLIAAYRLRDTLGLPFGAVVRPTEGLVGDGMDRHCLPSLWRALVVGLVDGNPSFVEIASDETSNLNAGHATVTADNAQVYGHPLVGEPSYVISQGAMVRRLDYYRTEPGRRLPKVAPPDGLPMPTLSRGLDDYYASAVYATLVRGDQVGRRLDRCIQWQIVAWSNTEAVDEGTRIVAFRAAFDVLLGGGAETKKHRLALSRLLGDDTKQRPRAWVEHGRARTAALNDTEWWFQSFAVLRNAISHGDEIRPEQWLFDGGHRHLWHADDTLRAAIKKTVIAATGDDDVGLEPTTRYLKHAYLRLEQDRSNE